VQHIKTYKVNSNGKNGREEVDNTHSSEVLLGFFKLTDVEVVYLTIDFAEEEEEEELERYCSDFARFSTRGAHFEIV
jgi:hypothetical protein